MLSGPLHEPKIPEKGLLTKQEITEYLVISLEIIEIIVEFLH